MKNKKEIINKITQEPRDQIRSCGEGRSDEGKKREKGDKERSGKQNIKQRHDGQIIETVRDRIH